MSLLSKKKDMKQFHASDAFALSVHNLKALTSEIAQLFYTTEDTFEFIKAVCKGKSLAERKRLFQGWMIHKLYSAFGD